MIDRIVPEAPKSFSQDTKAIWENLWQGVAHLDEKRDFLAAKTLCEVLNEYAIIQALLAGPKTKQFSKRVHENANGTLQAHPLVVQARELRAEIRMWLKALGLSPEDSAKLDLPNPSREAARKDIIKAADRRSIVESAK